MIALIGAGAVSLVVTLLLTPLFIRWVSRKKRRGGENVAARPPGMGGIVLIAGIVAGYAAALLLSGEPPSRSALLVLFLMFSFGFIGLVCDLLALRYPDETRLRGFLRFGGLAAAAAAFAGFALTLRDMHDVAPASTRVSFIRDLPLDFLALGSVAGTLAAVVWIVLIVAGTAHSVQALEGFDGLPAGSLILSFAGYVMIGFWQVRQDCFGPALKALNSDRCYVVSDPASLTDMAVIVSGALVGFLWWNTHPAQVTLGQTGALSLGGILAGLAILTRTELLLLLMGGIFVIVALSRIGHRLQSSSESRPLLRGPLPQRLEIAGWAQMTVVVRFWIVAGLCVGAGLAAFYAGWLL